LRIGESFFRISFDEGFEESRLSNTGRSNDRDQSWRRFLWDSVNLGNMESFFFYLDLGLA